MRRIISITLLILAFLSGAMAQEKQWNMLKNNKEYIHGEGMGETVEAADKEALADLISSITVSVKSDTYMEAKSLNTNGILNEESQFTQTVTTYSQLTLNNTERYVMGKAPAFRVGRAIKKEEIKKMFAEREQRARDMVFSADKAQKKGLVDDALRYYYWALTLIKSLQYPNAVAYVDNAGTKHCMIEYIKGQMDDIFNDVKFTCTTREGDDVDLEITFREKPVNSLSFTYFDGYQWSSLVSASDGYAKLEFAKNYSGDPYQIRIEYQFRNAAKADKELESVLKSAVGSEFPHADKKVKGIKPVKVGKKKPEGTEVRTAEEPARRTSFTSTNARNYAPPAEVENKAVYYNIVKTIETAIRAKATDGIRQYFTNEGWSIYEQLIGYGEAKAIGTPSFHFFENGGNVTARGLKLSFSFKNGTKKSFVEEVIFTFDSDNKICNLSFGLGQTAEDDILNKGAWDENVRLTLMNFLENYKTAYALKRYDYIKSIFDEDAIIIVGNIVKKAKTGTDISLGKMSQEEVKYNRYTKEQYMNNLQKCFKSQEYINIHFSNNTVRKTNNRDAGELYGIQIEQDYYSATYGDHGFLFLMVDFNDPKQPLIKVRTWQPYREMNNPKLNDGVYDLSSFF